MRMRIIRPIILVTTVTVIIAIMRIIMPISV